VLGPNDDTGAIAIIFKPGDANVIYASLWQTRRPPWNIYPPSNGPGSGLYKSTDGGDTWTHIEGHGFPSKNLGRIGIALSAAAPDRIYAIVDADEGGLYRSDDAGKTWKKTSGDPRIWQRGWYFGQITADPKDANRVYAMNTIELRSDDGGKTFLPVKGDPTGDDYHELWIDPNDPDRQIMAVNGGKTWSSWYNQPTAQMYHVSTDNRFPYRVYGAQQDSGAAAVPSRSTYEATINMMQFHEVTAGGESGMIAPDPDDPDVVYGDKVDKLDLKTKQTRSVDPTLAHPDIYRSTWTLPLVFNASDRKTLYFGNQRLWQTTDGGEHWTAISPDLSRPDPAVPSSLDATTVADNLHQGARRGVVYSIGSSPLNAKLLWVGTDDGLVWHTDDAGAHWSNVTPKQLGAWSKVGSLSPSHFDQDTAFASVDRHRLDDRKPYIYRTTDGGKTWQSIVNGIPDGDFVDVVREDPVKRGLLYAGTDFGIFVSFDNGDHWHSLQQNLPAVSVRDIDVKNDDLVIATHGRGFWIMDDVSALRQLAAYPASWATRLYKPALAYRVRMPMFTGTPLPKDEPIAENPPWGAYLDYSLAATPAKPIELSIVDANGKLVRSYSSADKAPKPDLAKINMTPDWFREPVVLETTPGLHRFVWPLRYAPPAALAHGDAWADGVWAPPGQYTVRLTVDGKTFSEPLTVAHDPRVTIPADAYVEQFDLARKVEAEGAKLATAMGEAHKLHAELGKRSKDASGDLKQSIDALDAKVVAAADISESPNPYNAWTIPPNNVQSFGYLGGMLALGLCLGYVLWAQARGLAASHFVPVTMLITAVLYGLAALVTFRLLDERAQPDTQALRRGGLAASLAQLRATFAQARSYSDFVRLMACAVFYQGGVAVAITLAAIYAEQVIGFKQQETMVLIFVLNLAAAGGAFAFGYWQDRIGHKLALAVTLVGWIATCVIAAVSTTKFMIDADTAPACGEPMCEKNVTKGDSSAEYAVKGSSSESSSTEPT